MPHHCTLFLLVARFRVSYFHMRRPCWPLEIVTTHCSGGMYVSAPALQPSATHAAVLSTVDTVDSSCLAFASKLAAAAKVNSIQTPKTC